MHCGVCGQGSGLWAVVDGLKFTDCESCGSIAMCRSQLDLVDAGLFERKYDDSYWLEEDSAARERSWGAGLARAAEAILLCNRPIQRFLDVGSGAGHLLDGLSYYLPSSRNRMFGIEKFPPDNHTKHPGFITGSVDDLNEKFDCGVCIEVVEHLTPSMIKQLARELASISLPDTLFVFNTGLSDFVRQECASYIDPLRRGHIISWGWPAIKSIFEPEGFTVHRLGQREWAFAIEFMPTSNVSLDQRIWNPNDFNSRLLNDSVSGTVMHILGRESFRCYSC